MTEPHSIAVAAPDWSRTPLGPPEAWPPVLRLTVDIMLNTPLPLLLMWGQQHIMVYNTAYAELALPGAQQAGASLPSLQPPAWSWNSAAIGQAWEGRATIYRGRELPVWRSGTPEPLVLDLHYTPVRNEHGTVAGVLCALAAATPVPTIASSARALRILVVEDNADAQYLVCETLRALGHVVGAALSAEEAQPLLAAQPFDVLFTDVSLPGRSGVELARVALRSRPAIAILFASGYGDELTRHLEFPSRSLQKPYDIDQLQSALDAIGLSLHGHAH